MLPKCLIACKDSDINFGYRGEVKEIYERGSFKKGDTFNHSDCVKLIDFYKQALKKYTDWSVFNFEFNESDKNEDISKFYADVEQQGYLKKFVPVNKQMVDELIESGKLYLFQIHNKDWLPNAKGSKNLQTMYWESMFSPENIKNTVIKLNGEAEVFFRDTQIKEKIVRLTTQKFNHNIITNSRYTEPKILFHVPITLNFAKNNESKIKELITTNASKFNVIGIDRGEKHLAYFSVVDQAGNLIKSESLNIINGVNYAQKLQDREDERLAARANWESISKIKELKEGYVAQVISVICDLMIEYDAIVIFENLNSGFKNGRKKIEKSIYQKLETALVNKLSYYVRKSQSNTLNAYQLTPKAASYADIEKTDWFGSVLFTTASYTSATCPSCGFRKRLYLQDNENLKEKFGEIKIKFDRQEYSFEYETVSANSDLVIKNKVVCNNKTSRCVKSKNELGIWETEDIDLFGRYNKLFDDFAIDTNQDINLGLTSIEAGSKFWKELLRIFNLLIQLRNSKTHKNEDGKLDETKSIDAIRCPSCGFDTAHNETNKARNIELINDADANGAYNIARKGIMMLKRIERAAQLDIQTKSAKPSIPNLYISDSQWDEYSQAA